MAWLSGLADKAENLLNKIDKNTAAVLNKDKYEMPHSHLSEVTWLSPKPRLNEDASTVSIPESLEHSAYIPSTSSSVLANPVNAVTSTENEISMYLNIPDPNATTTELLDSTTSSLLMEHPTDNIDSELSFQNDQINSIPAHVSLDFLDDKHVETDMENATLHPSNTVQNSNCEFQRKHGTETSIQNEHSIQDHSDPYNNSLSKHSSKANGLNVINCESLNDSVEDESVQKYLIEMESNLKKQNELFGKQETDHQKEIIVLNEKLKSLETEKMEQSKQIINLQFVIDRNRHELNSIRSELEQHKARALKTLQEKEKLIAELKSNASTAMDDATIMELNQLKQERDIVREENQQISQQLKMLREELINADLNLEKIRQKSVETNLHNQEILATERRRRLEAEEDVKLHSEETRSLKDELISQRNKFSLQLQKQDSEISRLRLQLSSSVIPNNEVDSRLTSLTQTLVLKQQALECLTTERNALRLQLEKLEHKYRSVAGSLRKNLSYNNINDTDDAKAQVPTFLMETPFDTSVTRRVKRAYSSLDAISVRTGVFLRRYPLARILVLIYMALLQFWVLVVLLSQSPEAH